MGDYKPTKSIEGIDIAEQLWQGLVLKEKDFRSWVKENDWSSYEDKAVYIHCSVDAIVPTWAYMLIGSQLEKSGVYYLVGEKIDLEKKLILDRIQQDDLDEFKDGKIIIKGCADIAAPEYAMVELVKHLHRSSAEIQRQNQELEQLANHDPLTGMPTTAIGGM